MTSLFMRQDANVIYFEASDKNKGLIVSLPHRDDVQIIWLDPMLSTPTFSGLPYYDSFPNRQEALKYVESKYTPTYKVEGYAILGYVHIKRRRFIVLIKSVKDIGKLLAKHVIYQVDAVEFIEITKVKEERIENSEEKNEGMIYIKQLMKQCYFSYTINLESTIDDIERPEYIWNYEMKQLFDFKQLGNVCPNLILGVFSETSLAMENFEDYKLIIMSRISREGRHPKCRETVSNHGYVMNQSEIDIMFINKEDLSWKSYTLIRGAMPINKKSTSPCIEAAEFVHKLLEDHKANHLNIINTCHTNRMKCHNHTEKDCDLALRSTVSFLSSVFKINLLQLDWECLSSNNDVYEAILPNILRIHEDYSQCFEFDKKCSQQKIYTLVTSPNGTNRANIVSFLMILVHIFSFLYPSESFSLDKLSFDLRNFIAVSMIKIGDLISSISGKISGTRMLIWEMLNLGEEYFQPINLKRVEDTILFDFIGNKTQIQHKCVSLWPSISMIKPPSYPPNMFAASPTSSEIQEEPIVIRLSEPTIVSKIIVVLSPDAAAYPVSSLSISGGSYWNRMFPILTNIAITQSEGQKSVTITMKPKDYYSHEISVNQIQKVRILSFLFSLPYEKSYISNIYVYGCNIDQIPFKKMKKEKFEFNENDKDVFMPILYEHNRLASFQTVDDSVIANVNFKNKFNPDEFFLGQYQYYSRFPYIKRRKRQICPICRNDNYSVQFDKNCILCTKCTKKKEKIEEAIPHFQQLKMQIISKFYPFIGTPNSEFVINAQPPARCLKNDNGLQVIPCSFPIQPPIGKNNVQAEEILIGRSTWIPKETFIVLYVLTHHKAEIKEIEMKCDYPIGMEIDPVNSPVIYLLFKPPGAILPVSPNKDLIKITESNFIKLRIFGSKVSISSLRFYGIIHNELPLLNKHPQLKGSTFIFQNIQMKNLICHHDEKCHELTVNPSWPIIGIKLKQRRVVRSLLFRIVPSDPSLSPYCFRVLMPDHLVDGASIFFKQSQRNVKKLHIWYIETNVEFELSDSIQLILEN